MKLMRKEQGQAVTEFLLGFALIAVLLALALILGAFKGVSLPMRTRKRSERCY